MSNNTTGDTPTAPPTTAPTTLPPTTTPAPPPTTSAPPPTTPNPPPPSTSNTPPPQQTSSSSPPPANTQPPPNNTSNPAPPPGPTQPANPPDNGGSTVILTETRTRNAPTNNNPTLSGSAPTGSSTSAHDGTDPGKAGSGGLSNGGKIAIAVVVPIAAIAILVLLGIFFWRKRKQRKDAEEQRRKEVEDYGYNPNADPTIPTVAMSGGDGYRGWGSTTLAGSTAGRKTSTTMSGGAAYSDAASPTRGTVSDTRSGEPLMGGDVPPSPEGEILGVMGPSASNNRGDVHRGPSNASSSYSAAARSDGSGDGPIGVAYGGPNAYYDQYGGGNPYSDNRPVEGGGQPIIRDVAARRNTRIESPAQYNQQTAGISQNF
ncbi:transmembrane alpha-helix domain-protein [Cladorrhinum sp. PSN259]|nr:transmembrane alpha-helix domain-protein [Cladorrhinum sp. PSN259]